MKIINLALTDDEQLFRKGMKMILADIEEVKVLVEAANGKDLLEQLRKLETPIDVVLLDLQMPVLDGIETTKQLQVEFPNIKVVILTTHYSKAFILNMIELGACAYLAKDAEPEQVTLTIQEVNENGFYYDSFVMEVIRENMVAGYPNKSVAFGPVKLTNREMEVLQLICLEKTTNEMADKLFLSPRTIEGHRNNLLEKTGAKNTAGLVIYAVKNKIVDPEVWKSW